MPDGILTITIMTSIYNARHVNDITFLPTYTTTKHLTVIAIQSWPLNFILALLDFHWTGVFVIPTTTSFLASAWLKLWVHPKDSVQWCLFNKAFLPYDALFWEYDTLFESMILFLRVWHPLYQDILDLTPNGIIFCCDFLALSFTSQKLWISSSGWRDSRQTSCISILHWLLLKCIYHCTEWWKTNYIMDDNIDCKNSYSNTNKWRKKKQQQKNNPKFQQELGWYYINHKKWLM